jgi:cell division protein FtsL
MEAKRSYNQYYNTMTSYTEGNTVRKLNAVPQREEEFYELPSRRRQEHRQTKTLSGINFASLLILTVAIIAALYVCVDYLRMQADVNRMDNKVVALQDELTTKTKDNDAAYAAVNTAYDLNYIYRVAVEELGMVYPKDNNIITYQDSEDDYVRQYEKIPE